MRFILLSILGHSWKLHVQREKMLHVSNLYSLIKILVKTWPNGLAFLTMRCDISFKVFHSLFVQYGLHYFEIGLTYSNQRIVLKSIYMCASTGMSGYYQVHCILSWHRIWCGRHFADDILRCIFLNEICCILFQQYASIGSVHSLSPVNRDAIIWINAGIVYRHIYIYIYIYASLGLN